MAGIKSRPGRNSQLPASVSTGHLVLTLLVQYERNRFPATGSGTVPLAYTPLRQILRRWQMLWHMVYMVHGSLRYYMADRFLRDLRHPLMSDITQMADIDNGHMLVSDVTQQ